MRTLALSLLIALAFSNPSQAQHRPSTENNSDQKNSSGTRGCPVSLPSLRVKLSPLAQNLPMINLNASESGYQLKMSIYPVEGSNKVVWTSEQTTTQGWQKINPRVTLDSGRKYAFAAVVPCEGELGSGEVLRTVFQVNSPSGEAEGRGQKAGGKILVKITAFSPRQLGSVSPALPSFCLLPSAFCLL